MLWSSRFQKYEFNSDKFKNSVKILNLKWTGNCGVGYGAEVF